MASRIEGNRKLGQNRSVDDQACVVKGLEQIDSPTTRSLAEAMRMSMADPDR